MHSVRASPESNGPVRRDDESCHLVHAPRCRFDSRPLAQRVERQGHQAVRASGGSCGVEGQHEGAHEARREGRRRVPNRQRPAVGRADPRAGQRGRDSTTTATSYGTGYAAFGSTGAACSRTDDVCSRAIGWSTSPARSSGSAVLVPDAGSRSGGQRRLRPVVPPDQGSRTFRTRALCGQVRLRQRRTTCTWRASGYSRSRATFSRLDPDLRPRWRRARLLRPPAMGLEDVSRSRNDHACVHARLRRNVRLDTGPAHARSGDRVAIAAYLGSSDVFDHAVADFAVAYADQNQLDFDTPPPRRSAMLPTKKRNSAGRSLAQSIRPLGNST